MDASADMFSAITDAVLNEVAAWQQGQWTPLFFFDAIRAKICDEGLVRN